MPRKIEFNHREIEPKWQVEWEKEAIFSPDIAVSKRPFYNLMMFPYPSAEGLHVGNMYAFTGADVYGRFTRMKGLDVFEPIGLDGFGIHSENYAISINEHPYKVSERTQKKFYKQLHATGNSFDWTKALETYNPDYYRWTQWIFITMFKNGLAYRQTASVNWCPSCKTVLADEQVIAGKCERCSTIVELKDLEQWFFRTSTGKRPDGTFYPESLLENLEKIDWSNKVKIAQRNWIGRSEGAEIKFRIKGKGEEIPTFTTRPDTLFGATFLVLSPDSPWVGKVTSKENKSSLANYIKKERSHTHPRTEKEKTGVFTGGYAINPATKEEMPIYVAGYVVGGYGSGAIMGVPAHDERDYEFAKRYKLPIKEVIEAKKLPFTGYGKITNSGDWNGWKTPKDLKKVNSWLEEKNIGRKTVSYHLRDWLISRQRYWGPPIPMIYCESCAKKRKGERKEMPGWYTVDEKDLPVELPYVKDYQPRGTGVSPLATSKEFYEANCPSCGKKARRETDVSDTFLDSSWYFLRYPSIGKKGKVPWDKKITKKWLPVDMYIGGAEHAVLHLLYARFITMAFKDLGLIDFEEPFTRFYAHGLLISQGAKMSKSRGNVVVPDEYIKKFGADTLRTYLMFLGPYNQGGDFRDTGIEGMRRFIERVWNLFVEEKDIILVEEKDSEEVYIKMHQTIEKVTKDLEKLKYNTAIAAIMVFVNLLREKAQGKVRKAKGGIRCAEWDEALRTLVKLISPFSPHMAEELWVNILKEEFSIHLSTWPKYEPSLIKEKRITIVLQVDGKLRSTIKVDANEDKNEDLIVKRAKSDEKIAKWIKGKRLKDTIFVPGKLVNFVT